ncbi:MAG: metal-sulfur cluster assembly factor [Micrococcales bacterium]
MPAELDPQKYDQVVEALKEVIDPELGVNIYDLGLIYDLFKAEDESLLINMTLTSAGCPLTDVIEEQTAEALDGVVEAFRINWVWMPPWGPERITDDGKEQMRAIGFSI